MDRLDNESFQRVAECAIRVSDGAAIALISKKFLHTVYGLNGGYPPRDLSRFRFPTVPQRFFDKSTLPPWVTVKHLFETFWDRALGGDLDYIQRQCLINQDFVHLALGGIFTRYKTCDWPPIGCLFDRLARANQIAAFSVLAKNTQISDSTGVIYVAPNTVNVRTGENYRYFRELVLGCLKANYPVERSRCTACRKAPQYHRGWTFRAIIRNDDLDLLNLYLNQPLGEGYTLYENDVLGIWLNPHPPVKIAEFWHTSGRVAALSKNSRLKLARTASVAQLEFAIQHGVNLNDVVYVRAALKSGRFHIALINAYQWNMRQQDRRHIAYHLKKWPQEIQNQVHTKYFYS